MRTFKRFFAIESSSGILLFASAIMAILIANSSLHPIYEFLLNINLPINILGIHEDLTIRLWINDFLMAIFFLVVGMEIKKEIMEGELSSKSKALLPLIAAFGGVIFPALIYICFNIGNETNIKGWAIPTATDIAFAFGIVTIFGKRIPSSLKIFIVALAVIDDLIAVLIIATFYTSNISPNFILLSVICSAILLLFNRMKIGNISIYTIFGGILWILILKSGIHATIAGVVTAFMIPMKGGKNIKPLEILHNKIQPYSAFLIMPIFAIANSGIRFKNIEFGNILHNKISISIMFALFFGKQIGVMLFSFFAIKFKICSMPNNSNWLQFYSIAIFTGIGFTMSLFVGNLSFPSGNDDMEFMKIGVIAGSAISAIFGSLIVYVAIYTTNITNKIRKNAHT